MSYEIKHVFNEKVVVPTVFLFSYDLGSEQIGFSCQLTSFGPELLLDRQKELSTVPHKHTKLGKIVFSAHKEHLQVLKTIRRKLLAVLAQTILFEKRINKRRRHVNHSANRLGHSANKLNHSANRLGQNGYGQLGPSWTSVALAIRKPQRFIGNPCLSIGKL